MPFSDSNAAGNKIIAQALQSPNYAQGSTGWTINRDGTAEFQSVLVRGTITGSTIIGSTIIGGTIIGGDIQSANFSNVADTGFDFNGTATTDSAGTPANTMQIYTGFVVGPPGGNNIQLTYSGTQSAIDFFTGNAADTVTAAITSTTFTQPVSGRTISAINVVSATEANGKVALQLFPSGGTTATDFPDEAVFLTQGTTSPSGWNGVVGRMFLGANGTTDVWSFQITNENSVISSGTTLGNPPIILGDIYTPRSRLFVSVSELLTVNGSGNTSTLFLNENNTEAVAGPIANVLMRHKFARDTSSHAGLNSLQPTFAVIGTTSIVTLTLPASGVITVHYKVNVTAPAVIAQSFYADVIIKNTTQSTTPYAGSVNNGSVWTTSTAVAADGTPTSVVGFTTFGAGGQGGILGNTGDTITVQNAYAVSAAANTWTATECQLSVIPSL
jgi:hypothetical protein